MARRYTVLPPSSVWLIEIQVKNKCMESHLSRRSIPSVIYFTAGIRHILESNRVANFFPKRDYVKVLNG